MLQPAPGNEARLRHRPHGVLVAPATARRGQSRRASSWALPRACSCPGDGGRRGRRSDPGEPSPREGPHSVGGPHLCVAVARVRAFAATDQQTGPLLPLIIDTYGGVGGQFDQLIRGAAALRAQQTAGTVSEKRTTSAARAVHKSFMVRHLLLQSPETPNHGRCRPRTSARTCNPAKRRIATDNALP
jgi:hypothetical protein